MSTLTKLIISNVALQKIGAKKLITFGETTPEGLAVSAVYDTNRDSVLSECPWTFAQKRAKLGKVITGATAANPVVITSNSHGFSDGDYITINNIEGMIELNGKTYIVAGQSTNSFHLHDEDGVNVNGLLYTTYTSLGEMSKKINPIILDDGTVYEYSLPSDFVSLNASSNVKAYISVEGTKILSDMSALRIRYTYANDDPTTYLAAFVEALTTKLAYELCFYIVQSTSKAQALFTEYEKVKLPRAMSADSQQGTAEYLEQSEWEDARR